jgi:predicted amino acid racemase
MNRVVINLEPLRHNLSVIDGWMRNHGARWTLVTKVLCGHRETLQALRSFGVRSMGESRLTNLREIRGVAPDQEIWFLRIPTLSSVRDVVSLTDVSLNSESKIIEELNEEAGKQGKIHRVIIMIELGDLREGILPETLVQFYKQVFRLDHIEVLGIGANLGCLAGAVPTVDQYTQLILYRELLELKFGAKLGLISAGTSATLPLLLRGELPKHVNHFRIGEALFLGTNLIEGGCLEGLREDTVVLESEIIEIKQKSMTPIAETGTSTPFETEAGPDVVPGQRGYRALVAIGQLDTEISGLTPLGPGQQIAGSSSDITVVHIGEEKPSLSVGDHLRFRPSYGALVRLMGDKYISKTVDPPLDALPESNKEDEAVALDPILPDLTEP